MAAAKMTDFMVVLFYACWDWRFLSLIAFSSGVDFWASKQMAASTDQMHKRRFLVLSLLVNLGFLGFFKYYNFFLDNFVSAFSFFGTPINAQGLNIILPVGISFYTFQTLSYTIDVYKRKLEPTKDFIAFTAFVSFFPQLVAGPIERASNLLPQFYNRRIFNKENALRGVRLILWGLAKKVVIADSIAPAVDDIFSNCERYPSTILLLGAFLFSFQIYCDFSGYSMMARGVSKLFGFELMTNFKYPYFSRNIGEFWRRWHISLSTWFRDYLYIPLGGSRVSKLLNIRNVFVIFLVSGFWHGANWTFVFWGAIHAILYIPVFLMGRNRLYADNVIAQNSWLPSLKEVFQVALTFTLVTFSRIFFRSESITDAFGFIGRIFTDFSYLSYSHPMGYRMIDYYILILFFVFYEFFAV